MKDSLGAAGSATQSSSLSAPPSLSHVRAALPGSDAASPSASSSPPPRGVLGTNAWTSDTRTGAALLSSTSTGDGTGATDDECDARRACGWSSAAPDFASPSSASSRHVRADDGRGKNADTGSTRGVGAMAAREALEFASAIWRADMWPGPQVTKPAERISTPRGTWLRSLYAPTSVKQIAADAPPTSASANTLSPLEPSTGVCCSSISLRRSARSRGGESLVGPSPGGWTSRGMSSKPSSWPLAPSESSDPVSAPPPLSLSPSPSTLPSPSPAASPSSPSPLVSTGTTSGSRRSRGRAADA
mmetsp:Transcript_18146/g.64263  ORF Transcript_18146/g.64263 Transcript_18146/m.64263 type:complete len:302 (+) Transcript_18146:1002-1907(+)